MAWFHCVLVKIVFDRLLGEQSRECEWYVCGRAHRGMSGPAWGESGYSVIFKPWEWSTLKFLSPWDEAFMEIESYWKRGKLNLIPPPPPWFLAKKENESITFESKVE